MIIKTKVYS